MKHSIALIMPLMLGALRAVRIADRTPRQLALQLHAAPGQLREFSMRRAASHGGWRSPPATPCGPALPWTCMDAR